MGYRSREIESKLLVQDCTLDRANRVLARTFGDEKKRLLFGSSLDTYWTVGDPAVDADFIRMRERDGIRQITAKGKDRGTNLDRLEVDIDSTSSVADIVKLLTATHGKPAGRIGKTYWVYWLGKGEHTTVCAYQVELGDEVYPHAVIEVETTSHDHMLELERRVLSAFRQEGLPIERAPGSLYEMFILNKR